MRQTKTGLTIIQKGNRVEVYTRDELLKQREEDANPTNIIIPLLAWIGIIYSLILIIKSI